MGPIFKSTFPEKNIITATLRGVGQVMFQNNALSGALFLLGIFYNSLLLGVGAVMGAVISTLFAKLIKYAEEDINDGLYGFNGTLVGIAVWVFFEVNIISTVALIVGAILSAVVMHEMKKRIPAYTAPFIVVTWVIILLAKYLSFLPFLNGDSPTAHSVDLFSATNMGLGQVMFQGNTITGVVFLAALLVNSRVAAIYALYGSFLGLLLAQLFSLPIASINMGIWGYNAVLCAIALGDTKWKGYLLATFAIGLSVFLNWGMGQAGFITLTAPFVLATWIALLLATKATSQKTVTV